MEKHTFSFDSKKKVLAHTHNVSEDLISPINNEKRGSVKSESVRKFNGEAAIREYVSILKRNKTNAEAQIKQTNAQLDQMKDQMNHIKDQIKELDKVSKNNTELVAMVKRQVPAELLKEPEKEKPNTEAKEEPKA